MHFAVTFHADPHNLHILNGGIEFGAGFVPLTTMQPHTTLRLTSVKLAVTSDVEQGGVVKDLQQFLLGVSHPSSAIVLEKCTFETTFDSPVMFGLPALAGGFGKVRLWLQTKAAGVR
jgi:hypothetical protein